MDLELAYLIIQLYFLIIIVLFKNIKRYNERYQNGFYSTSAELLLIAFYTPTAGLLLIFGG